MSFPEPVTIHVPQRDQLIHGDLRKLQQELSLAADAVNPIAGHEILRVQGGGKQLYVVVKDPADVVEGFTYTFDLGGCNRTRIGSQAPDALNWTEACEHIAFRLQLLLNTIATRLTRQAGEACDAARSILVSPST